VRAVVVTVTDELSKQPLEMTFIHGDNMIQQIPSAAFDPSLRHTVGLSPQLHRMETMKHDVSE
jgi:hypothetical protein